ncbi:aromatic ring-hydroxylating oxygenase subunit alpha [Mycobacterium vicinigordonae]|uniref:Aromatic ring-hydroxylating dioxygenase subunit alpha n=1 Tax=Mycobacterium vicinigordonae TaxID=1719132 RepID=A0A7D6HZ38_9MYCO|nr:aromatic ring-hydroxylating dioxygenase subunit alpha [Mycobacterium vicinigordonae]QLL06174.1 aromatic ring-hydroxylating dioxygenase subunit alpha [Mycobacterium vicinigordonae]
MQIKRSVALAERTEEECQRDTFPADFPNPIDVPAARYTDPEFLALEREYVLERSWLFVAHSRQLPEPGDFLMLDALDKLGHPIFLVRGRDGVIRAFYNSCRHRGGPLVDQPSGSTGRTLVCKYHAWSYDLTGKLLGFPEAKNFPRGAKTTCPPLPQVDCDTWGSLVFVKLHPGGPGLREYLEPVATELDGLLGEHASEVHLVDRKELDVACNWKLPGDGNIETYHVPFVHRDSAALLLDETRTGQWLLPNGHSRMLIRFRQPWPADFPIPHFSGDTSVAELGIYSFHVFPNLSIVLGGPATAFLITALPDGTDSCHFVTHFLSPVARSEQTAGLIDAMTANNWAVLLEDLGCMTAAQKSMRCGAADLLRLQYQERRIRYVHEQIDRCIGVERIPEKLCTPALLDRYVEQR